MECINCTACIDACDEIMEKVQKPKGLIKYSSVAEAEGGQRRLFSPRRAFYSLIILLCVFGLSYKLITRNALRAEVLRVVGAPYRLLTGAEEGMVINQFKLHLQNQSQKPMKVQFELINPSPEMPLSLIEQAHELILQPSELTNHFLFIKFGQALLQGQGKREISVKITYDDLENEPWNTPQNQEIDSRSDHRSTSQSDREIPSLKKSLLLLGPAGQ